ncbi:hypothetical protein PIROE2DRAFT_10411 [Piromyces sp. E2]|nr:hypothetical protein PIROE2DRAFT_10411 [Piromyces sp. E2]|eukprot:OUM63105.1 hypothetical protein PIROE2DRAFT_10411 [Piromyces sp. E2]
MRRNSFSTRELAKKDEENSELSSQNDILTQKLEESHNSENSNIFTKSQNENNEMIREFIECFKQYTSESDRHENQKVKGYRDIFYKFINRRLYYYKKIENSNAYERFSTPTTIGNVTEDFNNDIMEIRYDNDIYYNELKNPKVIFFRNHDNSCNIILSVNDTKYTVINGVNGRNIEVGENSFSVYEISDVVKSFTDNIPRLIYVDITGLYFVPSEKNSLIDIINMYEKEGEFNFKGSVLWVSALDGIITWNDQQVTEKNFFDNWIKEEKEIKKPITLNNGKQGWVMEQEVKTVLSTIRPKPIEILKNFYPPDGSYHEIFISPKVRDGMFPIENLLHANRFSIGNKWLNCFINKYMNIVECKSKNNCQELVKNGFFSSILSTYTNFNNNNYNNQDFIYNQNVHNVIQEAMKKEKPEDFKGYDRSQMIRKCWNLLEDLEFVKSLKPGFCRSIKVLRGQQRIRCLVAI